MDEVTKNFAKECDLWRTEMEFSIYESCYAQVIQLDLYFCCRLWFSTC